AAGRDPPGAEQFAEAAGEAVEIPVPVHPLGLDVRGVHAGPEAHFMPGAPAGLPKPHLGGMGGSLMPEGAEGGPPPEPQRPQRGRDVLAQHQPVRILRRRSRVHSRLAWIMTVARRLPWCQNPERSTSSAPREPVTWPVLVCSALLAGALYVDARKR